MLCMRLACVHAPEYDYDYVYDHAGSPPRGDAQGAQLVAELDDKVSAVMAALHLG